MSRIGKLPINIPEKVEVKLDEHNVVHVKGPLGELQDQVHPDITVKIEDGTITFERPTESKRHKSFHGLYRALVQNMIVGVTEGYKVEQELHGVGYKATNNGNILELSLGYSHDIYFVLPQEIKVETQMQKGQPPLVTLTSCDKQLIGQVAAKIRKLRPPEPYKGKGIRFKGEQIRRKAGKSAAK